VVAPHQVFRAPVREASAAASAAAATLPTFTTLDGLPVRAAKRFLRGIPRARPAALPPGSAFDVFAGQRRYGGEAEAGFLHADSMPPPGWLRSCPVPAGRRPCIGSGSAPAALAHSLHSAITADDL
jgi:hypothetical protein